MSANKFLQSVLGEDGAEALKKANQRVPSLGTVLAPRTIVSWLATAVRISYEGEIPGLENSYIAIQKSEEGFTGALTIGDSVHAFENSDLLHVAAAIGVALEVDDAPIHPLLKNTDLTKIGKSIDLLVKAKFVAKAMAEELSEEEEDDVEKVETPGKAAAPKAPEEPQAPDMPTATAPSTNKKGPTKVVKKELVIKKSEAENECPMCGLTQFRNQKFTGCLCFRSLAKSVTTSTKGDSLVLSLSRSQWDDETIQTLLQTLKG